ncbi:wax ester/triacylglycerol synthase family O-acyltransferase [Nocardioides pocheonensis]|uniref:Diacylglycerol O-acyltransferase n=1 Tax=Nocardioides pocheonensis TaxID=661485 RepID=A0A3N0GVC5_9ACTN|nr:wax ester/triacylglycerol synthase family O-acyltransferase [Nocardioides pocheonensis]RNM16405.1 wax ester/triacylglycerol synthase family O-acyltransferase [Nocardioides pocheonensis]
MTRHRMAPADAAWLRMDRPTNLMVVNSVMWFEEPIDAISLRKVLQERLVDRFPRFRQRAVEDHGVWWEDAVDFDLEEHLHAVQLPAPAGRTELEEFVARQLSMPLDRARPLWDLYVVEPYAGSGCALFFRMHHAIADGIALARVLLSLTDDPAEEVQIAEPAEEHGLSLIGALDGMWHEAIGLATHPLRAATLAQAAVSDATALAKLVLIPADHHTALRGTAGGEKAVVWSEPIALSRIKDFGHQAGATVNDVLLAAVAGALRTHLVRRRSPVHDIRAIVPFNLRALDRPLPAELGNKFGLVYLSLPLTTARRDHRLREMSRRMTAIKHSAEGFVAYGILELIGLAPAAVENLAIDVFASKGTGVMTNVPGPRRTVTLAGVPLRGTIGWVPTSGELGLGVAIFSYNGEVTVGLCVDRALVPDVKELLADFTTELEELLSSAAQVLSPR